MWKVTCDTAVKVEKDSNFVTNTIVYENNKKVYYFSIV